MSTHTPGPWGFRKHIFPATKDTYRLSCQEAWYLHGAENDSDFLADCFFKKDEHASSDIRLIAAAPDLLDVAMFFADCLQERSAKDRDTAAFRARWNIPIEVSLDEFSRSMVAAAIAKATKPAPGAKP